MDWNVAFDLASKLTLTVALVVTVIAFVLGIVESGKASAKRMAEYIAERDKREVAKDAERDKREGLIIAERDMWRTTAEAAQKQRDEADDRADHLASAFETAYRILTRPGGGPQIGPGT